MLNVKRPATLNRLTGEIRCHYCEWRASITDDSLVEVVYGAKKLEAEHIADSHPDMLIPATFAEVNVEKL